MSEWQDISTAPRGKTVILFFPEQRPERRRGAHLPAMYRVETYPVSYPREPTHWMPLPDPPTAPERITPRETSGLTTE